MNTHLSERSSQVKPSATMAMAALARELKEQGKDIISLTVGEPDFDTPDFIKAAAIDAIKEGFTKYTPVDGIPALKKAIITKLERDNQLSYELNEVIATNGVKQGLYNLCQALLNPGDEVIILAPYWVSYPPMAELAEAQPVIIHTNIEQDFKITPQQLAKAITPKTRLLMLNSPSNPSGKVYSKDELAALGEVLLKHPNVIIATDDIYEYLVWGKDGFHNILNACPELKERTVVFNGLSKSHAMTGWRIGYAAGPKAIIGAMKKIQSHSTSNPCSITQVAATTALHHAKSKVAYMFDAFKERHQFMYDQLKAMKKIKCVPADGTFYLFPNVSEVVKSLALTTDIELANYLLEKTGVATVPGTAFGCPGYLRISYATNMEQLKDACQRLAQVFDE